MSVNISQGALVYAGANVRQLVLVPLASICSQGELVHAAKHDKRTAQISGGQCGLVTLNDSVYGRLVCSKERVEPAAIHQRALKLPFVQQRLWEEGRSGFLGRPSSPTGVPSCCRSPQREPVPPGRPALLWEGMALQTRTPVSSPPYPHNLYPFGLTFSALGVADELLMQL